MKKIGTEPRLRTIIKEELSSWHQFKQNLVSQYPEKYKKAILEQRNIGWKNFLEGLVSKSMIQIQDEYCIRKGWSSTGQTWAKKIIKNRWKTIRETWDKRNEKLHSPSIIDKLEGYDALKTAISNEWQLGLHNLPPIEFRHLFNKHHTPEKIGKSLDQMKSWFSTIRSGRLLYQDTILQDEFSSKGPLQRWVGLSDELFPSKRESKAIQKLNATIQNKLTMGIKNLPPSSYTQFFRVSYKEMQTRPTKVKKEWLATVRKARLQYDKQNLIQDEFSKLGFYQQWVGLEHSLFI